MDKFKIVEKANPLVVHGLFSNRETAERHLREAIPVYVAKGYFDNKTLRANDFIVVPNEQGRDAS